MTSGMVGRLVRRYLEIHEFQSTLCVTAQRTGMQCRINNLLRLPQLCIHLPDLSLLVSCDQSLRMFQSRLVNQQCPVRC